MASVEAIGEPGTRRRRRGLKRWSGKREGAKSMRVRSFVIVQSGGGGWLASSDVEAELTRSKIRYRSVSFRTKKIPNLFLDEIDRFPQGLITLTNFK